MPKSTLTSVNLTCFTDIPEFLSIVEDQMVNRAGAISIHLVSIYFQWDDYKLEGITVEPKQLYLEGEVVSQNG